MRKDLLLEIGTEEIPARFMPGILAQLSAAAQAKFTDLRIEFAAVRTLGTPRRMVLLVNGLADKQQDISSEHKGPSIKVAFDNEGKPTKAGSGFARGQKVAVEDLVVKDGYVYAMVHENGQATVEILAKVLPELIQGLNFPKNMHWADLDMKFVRPIKWLVALFGDAVIPFSLAGITSGNISRGHRFLGSSSVKIADPESYESVMQNNFVIVDQAVREQMIKEQIEKLAAANGGKAEISEDLLEEVVYLVEYPTALCGKFEEKYLALPPETVITPMREHQRYFPVMDAKGKLLPLFITVRNGGAEHISIVQHGNERVLRARLADAEFFFNEDRKVKLVNRLEKLKTVVFQEGLGTIYDKTLRLQKMAEFLLLEFGAAATILPTVERAALLAKTDLVTGMVCEFTELQGVMGKAYALLDGETPEVAEAIYEHYLPRFAGDILPSTLAGQVVSIADKIDNIIATFSRGLVPTGSQDPYALRRQALGIVNILLQAKCQISLRALVMKSLDLLAINDNEVREKIYCDAREFFVLRLKNILSDEKIRYDIVDSVLAAETDNLYGAYLRAKAMNTVLTQGDMTKEIQAFVRAGNLAQKSASTVVSVDLFNSNAEKSLYEEYISTAIAVDSLIDGNDFVGAIEALADLAQPIDDFFAAVMVMDKDEAIRNNRLALLKLISNLIGRIADFAKIV